MRDKVIQNMTIAGGKFQEEKNYWLKKLANDPVLTGFPLDYSRAKVKNLRETIQFKFTDEVFEQIKKISKNSAYGVYMILMVGVKYLVFKYTGMEDIIIGAPVYKQKEEGNFLNRLLALRSQLSDEMTFKEALLEVRKTITEANKHQNYPLNKVLEELNIPTIENRFPLSNIMMMLENIHDLGYVADQKCDTFFSFVMKDDRIEGYLEYDSTIFRKETIEQIVGHLITFFELILKNPQLKLSEVEILSEEEKRKILSEFNDTKAEYLKDKTIHQLFEKQVEQNPNKTAVLFNDEQLTYRELNEKANQLARVLRTKGVQSDQIVGIMLE
ncbi:MAG: AMP-binding protein, partial [Halanaerobiales bacterium]|nr:AMP-binding protein [Halanaerobiales bacterium]